jgi:hypothetical protein
MNRAATPRNVLGRRPWLTLLGVLAIAIQCFVVQVHVHAWAAPLSAPVYAVDLDLGHDHDSADAEHASHVPGVPAHKHGGQQNCYLCQTALAGAAILSTAPSLNVVERNFVVNAIATRFVAVSAPRSHNWQSRAPPFQL